MQTMTEYVAKHGLTMTSSRISHNPNSDDWGDRDRHWQCEITGEGVELLIPFSQGSAHTKPPAIVDVLSCLASDASFVENCDTFEDFANELGYDPDSRKAEATYKACQEQTGYLIQELGEDAV